jgi:serine protease
VAGTVTEVEPNNSRTAAQVLTGAATVNGTISAGTDTDYYRISIAPGRSVVARLTPNTTSDYDLYVYNPAGTRIAISELGTGAVDSVTLSNSSTTTSMTAYLRVFYFSGGVGATNGKYTLSVQ